MVVIFYHVLIFILAICTISAVILGKSTFILIGVSGIAFCIAGILKRNLKRSYKIVDFLFVISSLGITLPFIYRFIR